MVQCGSFRGAEQAETVRAQLAFEGFDSKITTNNGWNRVVIGPVKGKENADSTLNRLKMAGHTNCIMPRTFVRGLYSVFVTKGSARDNYSKRTP
ncbi:cell division protein FtsN [Klebsiella pneumoniae]|nr:cell division protein FtsN [Klebsiella pneumoniae]